MKQKFIIEHQVLCLAARPTLAEAETNQLVGLLQQVQWEQLWEQAHLHEVQPLVARTVLGLRDRVTVPVEWANRAKRHGLALMMKNSVFADELLRVLAALEAAGVAAVALKGLVTAATVYGDLASRMFGDLDILVQEADLPQARLVLADCGYAQNPNPRYDELHHPFHDPPYYRRAGGFSFCIELHRGLWDPKFFPLSPARFWERLVPTTIQQTTLMVFSPEDMLIHLVIHRTRAPLRLRFVADIATLLHRNPALDWNYVFEQLYQAGASVALMATLDLARDLLGTPIPAQVEQRLPRGWLRRRLLEYTCGATAMFAQRPGEEQQPSLILRMLEQDGLLHVVEATAYSVQRSVRRRIRERWEGLKQAGRGTSIVAHSKE